MVEAERKIRVQRFYTFQPLLLRQARCALSFVPSLYINWGRRFDKLLPPGIRSLRCNLRVACKAADSL